MPDPENTRLRSSLEAALSFQSGVDVDSLESYVAICRDYDCTLGEFLSALLATSFWQQRTLPDGILKAAAVGLANDIDGVMAGQVEHEYHSRRHFKEVCLCLSLLLSAGDAASGWCISAHDSWVLLLAAIGHDYGHEGRPNQVPTEQEEKACRLTGDYLQQAGVSEDLIVRIQGLIHATEPENYDALMQTVSGEKDASGSEQLKILLVEADLFASMLPEYGKLLGDNLAAEFGVDFPLIAQAIASPVGRVNFLTTHRFISPNSQALNFDAVIDQAVAQSR